MIQWLRVLYLLLPKTKVQFSRGSDTFWLTRALHTNAASTYMEGNTCMHKICL